MGSEMCIRDSRLRGDKLRGSVGLSVAYGEEGTLQSFCGLRHFLPSGFWWIMAPEIGWNGEESKMSQLSEIAAPVAELLRETGQSISVAESSCGGLISAALVAIPGASDYYVGGSVIYTRVAQRGLLLVPDIAMEGMRASSEPYAQLNARTTMRSLNTDWGLAETGASGPTGNRYGDNYGHACIAVAGPVEKVITIETGDPDREANMWVFAQRAFDLLAECIRESRQ